MGGRDYFMYPAAKTVMRNPIPQTTQSMMAVRGSNRYPQLTLSGPAVIQEKNKAQGKTPATRSDLRLNIGSDNRIFLLNKGDGTIRVLAR